MVDYRPIKGQVTGYKLVEQAARTLDAAVQLALAEKDVKRLMVLSDKWMKIAASITEETDEDYSEPITSETRAPIGFHNHEGVENGRTK